jgi:hypothetical protein
MSYCTTENTEHNHGTAHANKEMSLESEWHDAACAAALHDHT